MQKSHSYIHLHNIEEQGLLLLCQAGLLQCLRTLRLQLSPGEL